MLWIYFFAFVLVFIFGVLVGTIFGASIELDAPFDWMSFYNGTGTWLGAIFTAFAAGLALWFQHKSETANVSKLQLLASVDFEENFGDVFCISATLITDRPSTIIDIHVIYPNENLIVALSGFMRDRLPKKLSEHGDNAVFKFGLDWLCERLASAHDVNPTKIEFAVITTMGRFVVYDDTVSKAFMEDISPRFTYL